jgi:hypothetical protein
MDQHFNKMVSLSKKIRGQESNKAITKEKLMVPFAILGFVIIGLSILLYQVLTY